MQWEVTGADRSSGEERSIIIEAETEDSARRRANRRGLLVADARPLDPDDTAISPPVAASTVATSPPPAPPQVIQVMMPAPAPAAWNPGVAAALSFVFPGLGQIYKGQIFNGLAWFLAVAIGYLMLILPGIILHILCIVGAASGAPRR